ncbi:MAG: ABC transporter permease [Betaproteobacteria bacterium]|nr:ABC transporter permease [Betaproteobacteria bacterium]
MAGFLKWPASAWRSRELLWELIRQDIAGRYRGSWLGLLWALLLPLLMLGMYVLVFGYFLRVRWADIASEGGVALALYAGILLFNFLSDVLTRAPNLIIGNPSFVKKVVFPLDLLPVVTLSAAGFHLLAGLAIWLGFLLVVQGLPALTLFWLPAIVLVMVPALLGLAWTVAATTVFLRDIGQIVPLAAQGLLFLSPVFYPLSLVPESWRGLMYLNPLTYPIEAARQVMLLGRMPDLAGLGLYFCASLLGALLGYTLFRRLRHAFADCL